MTDDKTPTQNNETQAQRPNILLITLDDMGPTAGCWGDHTVPTPNIDRLAAEGICFTRGYTTHASCSPARSSLYTGLYTHQNGHYGLGHRGYQLHRGIPTLPALMKQAGYRTCAVGKVHVEPAEMLPFETEWEPKNMSRRDVHAYPKNIERFIDDAGDTPWFVLCSLGDPHRPFKGQEHDLPEKMLSADDVIPFPSHGELDTPEMRKEVAGYYNAVQRIDIAVGLMMDLLERKGLNEKTLIVFTSDHGPPFARGKTTTYEFGTRVPYIVRWPGRVSPGQVRDDFVIHVDLMPTVLEVARIPLPEIQAGRSLVPLFEDVDVSWRETLFTEFTAHGAGFAPQRTARTDRFKLIHNLYPGHPKPGITVDGSEVRQALSDPKWTGTHIEGIFQQIDNPVEFELYDLDNDPLEHYNLADDPALADVKADLTSRLLAWREETCDPLLDTAYFERLKTHTEAHVATQKQATKTAQLKGTDPPYNRIDMRSFQEDWPPPWMH
ncbi:MAG: N-sulfoglucosamine sulfohydrolase [Candidatus Latescibacterota bacterium]|jgi:N-sulfoglucosamine sulfohydrolase